MPEAQLLRPATPRRAGQAARAPWQRPRVAQRRTQATRLARPPGERPHIVMVEELRREYGRPPLIAYAWVLVIGMGLLVGIMLGQQVVLTWR